MQYFRNTLTIKLNTTMINPRKILGFILALGVLLFSGCTLQQMIKMAKDQQLTVTPNPLELHGDSVTFELSAVLPLKLLKKDKLYTLATAYKYTDQKIELPNIPFKLTDYPNSAVEQPKVTKKFSFFYKPEIKNGIVTIIGTASDANQKSKSTPELTVASGIITTSRLYKDYSFFTYAANSYDPSEEYIPVFIEFHFEKAISTLSKKELKGATAQYFENFIKSKKPTRTVAITGTHSPEGAERINTKLSEDRAITIGNFYKETLKKYAYQELGDSIKFEVKSVVDDWTDFKIQLDSNATLTAEEKAEIKGIVDGTEGTFTEKEIKLQALKSYKIVTKDIYPKCRVAKTIIYTIKPKKTSAEMALLAKGITEGKYKADTLTDDELLYSATLTPLLEEKVAIYLAATKQADSWVAHNNLGAAYLETASKQPDPAKNADLLDKAITQLEISKTRKEAVENNANLASAYILKGRVADASNAIAAALSLKPSDDITKGLNSIKAAIEIRGAKYPAAISSASNGVSTYITKYDLALAYLLNKEFDKAKTAIASANDGNISDGLGYYIAAIIAARTNDPATVYSNLQKAISITDSLRAKALDDLEFAKLNTEQGFKDAVK
jgi:hypothetical protein